MASYCDIDDIGRIVDLQSFSTESVDWAAEAASRIVDAYLGRDFEAAASSTQTVYHASNGTVLLPTPFASVTDVVVDDVSLTADEYRIRDWGLELTDYRSRYQWYSTEHTVEVTATFGYSEVPSAVKMATALVAETLLKRTEARPVEADSEGNAVLPEIAQDSASSSNVPTSWGTTPVITGTTGSIEADRLLAPYRTVVMA